MSGGRFSYQDSALGYELFPEADHLHYDLADPKKEQDRKLVRRFSVFHDKRVSELAYDLLCLLNSLDYSESGDTNDEDYMKDLYYFKNKWFKNPPDPTMYIDEAINDLRDQLKKEFKGENE